jgi:hypothetical protein
MLAGEREQVRVGCWIRSEAALLDHFAARPEGQMCVDTGLWDWLGFGFGCGSVMGCGAGA